MKHLKLLVVVGLALAGLFAALPTAASAACTGVSDWSDLSTAFTNGGTVTLCAGITAPSGDSLTVGDGSAGDTTAVTLDLNGFSLEIDSPADDNAAIDVPQDASLTIEDSAGGGTLTVTGGYASAAIGGDGNPGGNTGPTAGTVTIDGGTVTATGSLAGPGIGGGAGFDTGGAGGSVTIDGGAVTATGGDQAAGIGGAAGDDTGGAGGSVTVDGGTVNATGGEFAPGIGGGSDAGSVGGAGASVVIGSGGTVTAAGGMYFGVSIGGGESDATDGAFGSLSNSGSLTVPSGSTLRPPSGVTADNAGTIDVSGSLAGQGTVDNTGAIVVGSGGSVSGNGEGNGTTSLLIEPNNYALSFNVNGGSGSAPGTMYVYAGSVSASGQSLPAGPTPPASGTFTGWFTSASGGSQINNGSDLASQFGSGPVSKTLYAQYKVPASITGQPQSTTVQSGDNATFTASASGIPAPTVQWQSCAPGADCSSGSAAWSDVAGGSSTTLAVDNVTVAQSGTEYRAVFTNSSGSADSDPASLTVTAIPQTITFAPLSPTATAGTSASLSATGGGSGQPVTFSAGAGTSPADACAVSTTGPDTGTVVFAHAGTCVIDADQAGSPGGDYSAAPTVSQTVGVQAVVSQLTLSSPAPVVFGQSTTVTATVSEADGSTPSGTVQFQVDGQDLGAPVVVGPGGTAASPGLGSLTPGAHTVTATFTPADPSVYAPGSASTTQTVDQAASTTTVAVQPTAVTATVVAVAPGGGSPTGTVTFSVDGSAVGSAALSNGTARLGYAVPSGKTHQVAAVYAGDSDFTGSSASTSRSDPTIVAHLSSAHAKTRYGWYRSPVTVTFTCTTHGAALTASCPSPVRLAASKAGQSVTRTITATDGGAATVVVSGIDIDQGKPTVKLSGIHRGAVYGGTAPTVHCAARGSISGFASCKLRRHETTSDQGLDITTIRYTATATSRAGKTATASVTYRQLGIYLEGARYQGGTFLVTPGRTYTIVVERSSLRPRYVDAAPSPVSPAGNDEWFASVGRHGWAQGVTINAGLGQRFKHWVLGVQIGSTLHDLDVQLS